MRNGIYEAQFHTANDNGSGLLVVRDGTVNGGDPWFLYRGEVRPVGDNHVVGRLRVTQWQNGNTSVFGTTGEFYLDVTGTIDGHGTVSIRGVIPGQSQALEGTARPIGDLA